MWVLGADRLVFDLGWLFSVRFLQTRDKDLLTFGKLMILRTGWALR